jgi:Ca2+-binding EF-hand superfamily protein
VPAAREREPSPPRGSNASPGFGGMLAIRNTGDNNAVSKLQPAQVRELREGFQILDRDSDGQVGREDIADMLAQLGKFAFYSFSA